MLVWEKFSLKLDTFKIAITILNTFSHINFARIAYYPYQNTYWNMPSKLLYRTKNTSLYVSFIQTCFSLNVDGLRQNSRRRRIIHLAKLLYSNHCIYLSLIYMYPWYICIPDIYVSLIHMYPWYICITEKKVESYGAKTVHLIYTNVQFYISNYIKLYK